jgi:hypothetical protein
LPEYLVREIILDRRFKKTQVAYIEAPDDEAAKKIAVEFGARWQNPIKLDRLTSIEIP